MVNFIFFRLARKRQTGVGRRYYRLLSYPQDSRSLASEDEAMAYASHMRYAAIRCPDGKWIALDDKARQCIGWYQAGKEGYVHAM